MINWIMWQNCLLGLKQIQPGIPSGGKKGLITCTQCCTGTIHYHDHEMHNRLDKTESAVELM